MWRHLVLITFPGLPSYEFDILIDWMCVYIQYIKTFFLLDLILFCAFPLTLVVLFQTTVQGAERAAGGAREAVSSEAEAQPGERGAAL